MKNNMSPENYSPEQQKDIEERVEKAKGVLKELQLQPACLMTPVNVGNDAFGLKPIAFLQDLKFTPTTSPVQQKDL